MYQLFGATVTGDTVTFRVFLPDARKDPSQYNGDAFPFIREIRAVGSFQRAGGGWAWDPATGPVLERRDHPSGDLYVCQVTGLDEGWYEYKYVVTFEGGLQRWVTDPCTKYLGRQQENSGFVVGGPPVEIRDLPEPLPMAEEIFAEINVADTTANYRGDRSPADALLDRLDHIESLGVNAIQFMPWAGWWGPGWGYTVRHFFAVEEQLVADPADPANRLHQLGRLIDACHERNIACYADAVLNHVDAGDDPGTGFGYRWLYRDPADSPYVGRYEQGLFFDDLNFANGCVQQFATDVCRYWLDRFKFDGLRLDYTLGFLRPDDVTTGAGRLIRDLRDVLDTTGRSHVRLVTEHLPADRYEAIDAVNRFWASATWWELVMHGFRQAIETHRPEPWLIRALGAGELFTADGELVSFISQHDYRTLLVNAGGRAQWWRMQPALVAIFTMGGAVLIRLGEDFGQQFAVPDSGDERILPRPLDWSLAEDDIGRTLIDLHRRLASLRAAHPALHSGRFRPFPYANRNTAFDADGMGVHTERGLIVFAKAGARPPGDARAGEEHIIVALNVTDRAQETTVTFPHTGIWQDLLEGPDLKVLGHQATIAIPSHWARILVCTD